MYLDQKRQPVLVAVFKNTAEKLYLKHHTCVYVKEIIRLQKTIAKYSYYILLISDVV
jgi:hypothetical protein